MRLYDLATLQAVGTLTLANGLVTSVAFDAARGRVLVAYLGDDGGNSVGMLAAYSSLDLAQIIVGQIIAPGLIPARMAVDRSRDRIYVAASDFGFSPMEPRLIVLDALDLQPVVGSPLLLPGTVGGLTFF